VHIIAFGGEHDSEEENHVFVPVYKPEGPRSQKKKVEFTMTIYLDLSRHGNVTRHMAFSAAQKNIGGTTQQGSGEDCVRSAKKNATVTTEAYRTCLRCLARRIATLRVM
jgi:hypothetical protein